MHGAQQSGPWPVVYSGHFGMHRTTMNTLPLELRHGDLRLALRPDLGASIAGFWMGGTPVLRSVEAAALDVPRSSGCFPLVPYSNRIADRQFTWQGEAHTLAANFERDYPHALHGSAWLGAWNVKHADAHSATLGFTQQPDAHWPFAFEAQQHVELNDDALMLKLKLTNTDASPQPTGLGWHPYFPKRSTSRLHVECSARWERDTTTHLPTQRVPQRGIDADVRYLDFDHCFEGWPGSARVRDAAMSVVLSSSLPYLVVYTPQDRDYFCVEPVSHVSNAINMASPAEHGVRTLAAGESFEAWMKIEVHRP
jgi:aldose 1-epimerase